MMQYTGDKYMELQRDIAALGVQQANLLANQNSCCCSIQRGLDGVNYNMSMAANETQKTVAEWGQKILDAYNANRMAAMQNEIDQLRLNQAMAGVVRYPDSFAYNAGNNPFCGCGNNVGCCNI